MARRWQPRCFPRGTTARVWFDACRPLACQAWFDPPRELASSGLQELLNAIQAVSACPPSVSSLLLIWNSRHGA